MPGSQQFRLRLPPLLVAQVQALAELWDAPFAAVLRVAVEQAMQEPDKIHERLALRYGVRAEHATPEQQEASDRYLASVEPMDLGVFLAEHNPRMPY